MSSSSSSATASAPTGGACPLALPEAWLDKATFADQYLHSSADIDAAFRETEFPQIRRVYVDHAGAPVPPRSVLDAVHGELLSSVFGNPHSINDASARSEAAIDGARGQILAACGVDSSRYTVIFTASATAALKLVGEALAWGPGSQLGYLSRNHNSVLGLRALAPHSLALDAQAVSPWLDERLATTDGPHLLAYPGKCNFSGQCLPLDWVRPGTAVLTLLDAASLAPGHSIDLSVHEPHFVALSFYKMFGYPTGVGALLVHRSAAPLLRKRFFGGGTVEASLGSENWQVFRKSLSGRFEDGTLPFLAIAALRHGFAFIARLGGFSAVGAHSAAIAAHVKARLAALRHGNGRPVCVFYDSLSGDCADSHIVNFNVLAASGETAGHSEVGRLAALAGIDVRTGAFCNPGAAQAALGMTPAMVRAAHAGGVACSNGVDAFGGVPTGSVRLSFGFASTWADADAIVLFVASTFCESAPPPCSPAAAPAEDRPFILESILLYPLKSCAAIAASQWAIGPQGLLYDREWAVADPSGRVLSQKEAPRLCLVAPALDLERGTLTLAAPGHAPIQLPLDQPLRTADGGPSPAAAAAAAWLGSVLGRPVTLLRLSEQTTGRKLAGDGRSQISFANESQFLLISRASVDELNARIQTNPRNLTLSAQCRAVVPPERFRPNLIVSGGPAAFAEDAWAGGRLSIGALSFVSLGSCTRCRMVCIDQSTGESAAEPLLTLSSFRRMDGAITFGHHLVFDADAATDAATAQPMLSTGAVVRVASAAPSSQDRGPYGCATAAATAAAAAAATQ